MRLSAILPWRLSAGIFALILILALAVPLNAGDTGTYKLSDYVVTLEPQSSGQVKLTIEQQWQVLGGNIPWITVGLPNSSFSIVDYSGAAARVSPENSGGFTGVRIDLDQNYQASQNFQVKFTVLQSNLLED